MEYFFVLLVVIIYSFTGLKPKGSDFIGPLVLLLLILFSGTRFETGNDWGGYLQLFHSVNIDVSLNSMLSHRMELGYVGLNVLVKSFGGQILHVFLICAAFTVFLVYRSSRVYTPFYPISMLLFMRYGYLQFDMMFVRQGIAVAIFFYAIRFIYARQVWSYFVLIFLASLFHASAVILFPMYFLLSKRYNPKIIVAILIISFLFGLSNWFVTVVNFLPMDYGKLAAIKSYVLSDVWGVRKPLSFSMLEKILILVTALVNYRYLAEQSKYFNIFFNMAFIALVVSLLFNNYYVFSERLGIIFNMSYIVLVSYFLYLVKSEQRVFLVIALIAFVVYWFVGYITTSDVYLPYNSYLYL